MARKPMTVARVRSRSSRAGKPKTVPRDSFFKIMFGDFTRKIRIPPAFIKHFDGNVPYESILRSPTGKVWHVEVEKVDNNLFFQNGWRDFVEENSVKKGELLIFTYQGNSEFNVKIYGKSGCEKKEASQEIEKNDEIDSNKVKESKEIVLFKRIDACQCLSSKVKQKMESDGCPFNVKNLHYTTNWRNKYNMHVPKTFVDASGIGTKTSVVLHDPKGKQWTVNLLTMKDGRTLLGSGWLALARENGLGGGGICGLECIRGSGRGARRIFQVHIFHTDQ